VKSLRVLLVAVALLLLLPARALAQTGATVTLDASASKVDFGQKVTLSGTSTGVAEGSTVQFLDQASAEVGTATTDASGAFSVRIEPQRTNTYVALVADATSEPVTVSVRAVLKVRMGPVRLFDRVLVRGVIKPARDGEKVDVALVRSGNRVSTRQVAMAADGTFRARLPVDRPGTYRAQATFVATDLLKGSARSSADSTPLPHLSSGSSGTYVRLLEKRLVELHYRLAGRTDGRYDFRTGDAVVAFHKVQGMARTFTVNEATWRRLADPRVPHAVKDWRGFHFEVDQTKQVLYTVEDGDVTNVLHVSTGAGGATHDGTFRVFSKLAGFSPHHLYYPSFFDGERALHGWTEVPTYAASHGCVRIPYWNAKWVYYLADYGVRVVIYH
jgi:L,D-transpeptidase-like protein/putative peptidoglycan binding protein